MYDKVRTTKSCRLNTPLTRYQALVEVKPKMTEIKMRKKRQKLWIPVKRHAHLQNLTKIHAEFQKDWAKIVGGVAFTRYPALVEIKQYIIICGLQPNVMDIFRP